MSTSSILWPMLAHIAWVFMLYAWLTVARTLAVQRGEVDYSAFVLGRDEPLPSRAHHAATSPTSSSCRRSSMRWWCSWSRSAR